MVKKAGTVILLLTILILTAGLLTACGPKKYKITITSGEDLIDECPKRAAEGETVKIITCGVTDADLYVNVVGASRTIVPMNLSCLPKTLKWKPGSILPIMMRMEWGPDS